MSNLQANTMEIAGYAVETVSIGKHKLGKVEINKDISVVFPVTANSGETAGIPDFPDIDVECLTCKISKISQCADVMCSDLPPEDHGRCGYLLRQCIELACDFNCRKNGKGADVIILG